ncbi:MAG: pyridoxal-phosphate dependent enzyme [Saccharospirillum sp.]|nr:pyridoxal-phosphate dependent enzyme [Saccharospirillum sp.]
MSVPSTPKWYPLASQAGCELWLCQPVTIEGAVSGNKIAKLRYPLLNAQASGCRGIATFGGAFSNHLLATAAACEQQGLQSLGFVRTDRLDPDNPTLRRCHRFGMSLIALSRADYRRRHDPDWLAVLQQRNPGWHWVPEGGTSSSGVAGVREWALAQSPQGAVTHLVTATGSGGTLAGLALGHPQLNMLGMAVVKDDSLPQRIRQLCEGQANWHLSMASVGPGYGRFTREHLSLCLDIRQQIGVSLEPIYTGKALFGLLELINQGHFKPGSRIGFVHTGGLQGLDGLHYRGLIDSAQWQALTAI